MKFNKIKNIILKFTIISFFLLEVFTSEIFAQNLKDLQKAAAKAVDAASVCYRSLPSHAQNSAVNSMLDARRYYEDAVKFLNMNETYRSMAGPYFNNAISYSNVVKQIGSAYGSKLCN
jgi:hypothetical protein